MEEALIWINGTELTEAQSAAVRVAVSSMLSELGEPKHLKALGEIGPLYQARLGEVQNLILHS